MESMKIQLHKYDTNLIHNYQWDQWKSMVTLIKWFSAWENQFGTVSKHIILRFLQKSRKINEKRRINGEPSDIVYKKSIAN